MVQDDHRAVVDGQPPEPSFQLIAIDDGVDAPGLHRLVSRQEAQVGRPRAGLAPLGVAGTHQEPIRPGLEAGRVAQGGKVTPDGQQRLLRGVLGEIGIAQDPERHRMEPIADGDGEAHECLLVAALRSCHEMDVHASCLLCASTSPRRIYSVWAA